MASWAVRPRQCSVPGNGREARGLSAPPGRLAFTRRPGPGLITRRVPGGRMDARRQLLVIADDFGIGPETSHAILDLGRRGRVGGTVLLVNSPHAAEAVA